MEHLDHEARRRKIAETVADIVAREGIDAATMRHIAARVGCSTTLITDCFEDKRELLVSAYRLASQNTLTRFEARMRANPADIVANLVSLSAVDEASWVGWRVHVAFLERAVRDPILASEQRVSVDASHRTIERAITQGYGPGGDIKAAARLVVTLIHGLSVQAMFEQQHWSHAQIHELIANQLSLALGREPLGAPQGRANEAAK